MSQSAFEQIMTEIAGFIAAAPLDAGLAEALAQKWPADSEMVSKIRQYCAAGLAEGWLMQHEGGGIRFGRAIKPGGAAGPFSVDVVQMDNLAGPHHIHDTGEIGLIMPISGPALFDGLAAGWYVYPPGSDHFPTVTGGSAFILYLLPDGKISFTGKKAPAK